MITRTITKTTVTLYKIEILDGQPEIVEIPSIIIQGNVTIEKAQRHVNKELGKEIRVLEVETDSNIYQMTIEDFIENGTIKEEQLEIELL